MKLIQIATGGCFLIEENYAATFIEQLWKAH